MGEKWEQVKAFVNCNYNLKSKSKPSRMFILDTYTYTLNRREYKKGGQYNRSRKMSTTFSIKCPSLLVDISTIFQPCYTNTSSSPID